MYNGGSGFVVLRCLVAFGAGVIEYVGTMQEVRTNFPGLPAWTLVSLYFVSVSCRVYRAALMKCMCARAVGPGDQTAHLTHVTTQVTSCALLGWPPPAQTCKFSHACNQHALFLYSFRSPSPMLYNSTCGSLNGTESGPRGFLASPVTYSEQELRPFRNSTPRDTPLWRPPPLHLMSTW